MAVTRVVLHVEEHAGGQARRQVLDEGAATVPVAAARRRESAGPAGRPQHVLVPGEAPEALAPGRGRRRLVPVHRVVVAQPPEGVVRGPVGEEVGVGQVDRRRRPSCAPSTGPVGGGH